MKEGAELMDAINKGLPRLQKTEVIVAPPAPFLAHYASKLDHTSQIQLSAQQCSANPSGAHTGEFTAEMLRSCGINTVIIGHSERRDRFGENFDVVREKVEQAVAANLHVLLCCGEPLEVRETHGHFELIAKQLKDALLEISIEQMQRITIAYEPVWAIGTGVLPQQTKRKKCITSFGSNSPIGTALKLQAQHASYTADHASHPMLQRYSANQMSTVVLLAAQPWTRNPFFRS